MALPRISKTLSTGAFAGPGTEILLAHVRRWKSDARFFQALRKAGYTLVDAEESAVDHTQSIEGHPNRLQSDSTVIVDTSNGGCGTSHAQTSLHTKGALKIFKIRKSATS